MDHLDHPTIIKEMGVFLQFRGKTQMTEVLDSLQLIFKGCYSRYKMEILRTLNQLSVRSTLVIQKVKRISPLTLVTIITII